MSTKPDANGQTLTSPPRERSRRKAAPPDPHRVLPHSMEAEMGLLSSALLDPSHVLADCVERIDETHFHHPAHTTLYQLLIELWQAAKPIDFITVTQILRDRNILDSVGGPDALTNLFTFVPTAANAEYYLNIVQEKTLLRRVITVCTEFAARSYDEQGNAETLLDEVESRVLAIAEDRYRSTLKEMKEHVNSAVDAIEMLYKNKGQVSGLATGFSKLDAMTSGLHGGEMFVIAARPSMGKTALAMNIAEHVTVDLGKPVGVFSLEMSNHQLTQRLLCSRAKVNMQKVRDGFLSPADVQRITAAAAQLSKAPMYLDDTPSLSILEFRAKARRLYDRHKVELLVIDYLQLLRSTSRRAQDNRQIEIAEISSGIKALSKELNIPVIVLAQLNRKPDERGGTPRMSDLRESGSIEQDADVIALLVRAEVYEKDEEAREEKYGEAELIIAKQRNGPTGEVPLSFLKEFTRFEDRAPEAAASGGN